MYLVQMSGRVKYLSCDIEGVSNNYNMLYTGVSDSLINTTSDCEELSLSSDNISGPIQSFDNGFVEGVDVQDGCSDLILDVSI